MSWYQDILMNSHACERSWDLMGTPNAEASNSMCRKTIQMIVFEKDFAITDLLRAGNQA